jgi:hypothetical protein
MGALMRFHFSMGFKIIAIGGFVVSYLLLCGSQYEMSRVPDIDPKAIGHLKVAAGLLWAAIGTVIGNITFICIVARLNHIRGISN